MAIDRRRFLLGSALLIAGGRHAVAAALGDEAPIFASACRRGDGSFSVVLLDLTGRIIREMPIAGRGHDIALHRASARAVVFARRPGFFAVAFDLEGRSEPTVFTPQEGRHFFGHGAFSRDGRRLFVSEHDIDTGDGLIGVYDVAAGYRRVGEFPSQGVGPHEAILMADGRTLAIANGGIATDPSTGREALNLPTMKPSLAFIDSETGELMAKHSLPSDLRMLSIRHIAADGRGRVWFGGQWQGGAEDAPELIGFASLDRPVKILEPASPLGVALKGYIGSVAMSRDGRILAASAPRAGRIVYVDTDQSSLCAQSVLADGCGVAGVVEEDFALSSGLGVVRLETPGGAVQSEARVEGTEFDNHLRLIA